MRLFARKPDPLREYERHLAAREAELRAEIARLHARIEEEQNRPQLRSTANPPPAAAPEQLAFEQVSHQRVIHPRPAEDTAAHYNELGVRKYDPLARLRRWWEQLRAPRESNPALVRLLAAGNVHGLKPLRYEKRVARNRFLALLAFFILVIWGLIYFYQR
jgi:hypothetical protein